MENLSVVIVLYAGITHALEADHVLAVSNIVSQRKNVVSAVKDGIFWGLGHTSTILLVGLIVLVFKSAISDNTFHYFEAAVGLMLIIIAVLRLIKLYRMRSPENSGRTVHGTGVQGIHVHPSAGTLNLHKVSYGIGLVHGLAGSGALLVLATTQVKQTSSGMIYLLLFGLGSMIGMAIVSGLFSIPFSKRLINNQALRTILTLISSGICIVYGAYVVYENLHCENV